jgi:hypothetical protein
MRRSILAVVGARYDMIGCDLDQGVGNASGAIEKRWS